ncbi:MAG: hypothetical protein GWO08_07780 [Gammaproteobacteria bacterium]|nr:hypothetical protein [candidate division Zixibacteria bacterium]NIR65543.1 hypothetical protein [candidate division Zixibacteria bacterium]NIR93564.1 hypothetical protein [Gammaproteobacteria bacterium]NIS47227.1 hypothetical protein [candidate division Zixibacteria bacterium]NIU15370.1 hypothetical protein [candidate division Zixibacteria bacterium]
MAYDKTKPADDDKISTSAGNLRDNFAAIEDGEVEHVAVQVTRQSSAPTPSLASNAGMVYGLEKTQDDGSTTSTELIYEDEDSNTTQLTFGGKYLFPRAFGEIDGSAGTLVANTGYNIDSGNTAFDTDPGIYKITFNNAMPRANYIVHVTPLTITDGAAGAVVANIGKGTRARTTTELYVEMTTVGNAYFNSGFTFVVYSLD